MSPATRSPAREADAPTRERILQVALEAFAERGFDGASTRAIAGAAGVNQGLIPYYFGTKEALWREAVDRAFGRLGAGLDEIVAAPGQLGDRERLARLIRRYVRFVAAHPEFVRMMHEEGKREGERMRWLVDRHVRPLFEAMTGLFEAARLPGQWPEHVGAPHFHYLFAGAVDLIFHQAPECRRLTGRDPSDPDFVDGHADAVVHLFLGDASLGREP
jgi:TetR/AcrR family transcriptional regulator